MNPFNDRRSSTDRRGAERRATHASEHTPLNRRAVTAGAAAVVLAVAGLACVGYAATNQHHFPEPALSAADVDGTLPAALGHGTVGPIMSTSVPTAIAIPAIGVNSSMVQLGQTPTGEVEVPLPGPLYDSVGWYKYSPTPGSLGPAVVVGHVDSKADGPSVFFKLGGLHAKDRVSITRANGSVAVFAVDRVLRFEKSQFPTALVYGDIDHAGLRLVTCGGPFDHTTGHYRDNIIVIASLVSTA